ncbi:hypothetical protein SAMN02745247_00216 [Butyrivibrio hungatei DSM 14810]|uniref:Uncharacterized protein n=1 Tax=Butyrivibrio hungatei DSM 14810 TaxID=1121132 RepID=A0A1M7RRU8_9FIRM|nr:hypothetical protein [Butyrivibrio hungatei]SHN49003.1 hypothetical protein SAMN02745247_00216 [Butyrivibrio hungatei DSM 14810]
MAYGYNDGELMSAIGDFETTASNFMSLVTQIGDTTSQAVGVWEADSYVDFRANLDNYANNASALSNCVNAVRNWTEGLKAGYDGVDQLESEKWQGNGGY